MTIATDLFAPKITATKTVDRATANLGDTLTYSVAIQNTGQDAANGTTFTDPIPAGATYVPGSLRVGGNPVTDAGGDDVGEFAGGQVVARLGTGASAAAGGALAPNASTTVSFQVTVNTSGLALGATIDNTASLAFTAATTGVASTVNTAPATTRVLVPDLAIGKSHSPALAPGGISTYTITVSNVGDGPTAGAVTVDRRRGCRRCRSTARRPDRLVVRARRARPSPAPARIRSPPAATIRRSRFRCASPRGHRPDRSRTPRRVQAPSDGNPDNNSFTDAGARQRSRRSTCTSPRS